MISISTPTTAIEIVRHISAGGRCLVQVLPHGHVTVTYPRDVEQVQQDGHGEWWFGVQFFAFQWLQFPSQGLSWTLVANECETPKSWPAAKNLPAAGQDPVLPAGTADAAAESCNHGGQRSDCEDAAGGPGHVV